MIYILFVHDKPLIWSPKMDIIEANVTAIGGLAKWARVEAVEKTQAWSSCT